MRENIPALNDDVKLNKIELRTINETLPKHSNKIIELQKAMETLNEAFANDDEKISGLNKLVTDLFS